MPGEHWCSYCEKDLSKHKGKYSKLYWRNFDDEDEIINVVCPDCQFDDEKLNAGIKYLEENAKPVEVVRGRVCTFCGESIKKKETSLRAEFRYDGTELRCDACEKCLEKYEFLRDLKPKKKNPIFNVEISCSSIDNCESFKKPKRNRGINCGHVCINIEGELYCRRGHPGHVKVYRERWALPPNRKQLMTMLKEMRPLFKQMSGQAQIALDRREEFFKSLEEESSTTKSFARAQAFEIPINFKYELVNYPIEDGKITMPWKAHAIKIDSENVLALMPIDDVEEGKSE